MVLQKFLATIVVVACVVLCATVPDGAVGKAYSRPPTAIDQYSEC